MMKTGCLCAVLLATCGVALGQYDPPVEGPDEFLDDPCLAPRTPRVVRHARSYRAQPHCDRMAAVRQRLVKLPSGGLRLERRRWAVVAFRRRAGAGRIPLRPRARRGCGRELLLLQLVPFPQNLCATCGSLVTAGGLGSHPYRPSAVTRPGWPLIAPVRLVTGMCTAWRRLRGSLDPSTREQVSRLLSLFRSTPSGTHSPSAPSVRSTWAGLILCGVRVSFSHAPIALAIQELR